jgi:hypothetical protein
MKLQPLQDIDYDYGLFALPEKTTRKPRPYRPPSRGSIKLILHHADPRK